MIGEGILFGLLSARGEWRVRVLHERIYGGRIKPRVVMDGHGEEFRQKKTEKRKYDKKEVSMTKLRP